MSKNKTYTVKFRRKREGKTDYKKRIKYISSGKTRIVIRVSNNNIKVQAINFGENGDLVLGATNSLDLKKFGWKSSTNNLSSAYLTGFLFGNNLRSKISEGIIDAGLKTIRKNTKLSAVIKGIIDSGLKVPCSEEIFPLEEKINGKITSEYSKKLKESDETKYKLQFSKYLKEGINPEDLPKHFEELKKKLVGK
jgi:large subunit ribosomal protein L18